MAEQIDLPFGLWTRMGRRNYKFNRIRQVAPMCPLMTTYRQSALMRGHIGATWRIRLNRPSAATMRLYVKLLLPLVTTTCSK